MITIVTRGHVDHADSTGAAGRYGDAEPLAPPSSSWASRAESDVAVWMLELQPQARVELPAPTQHDARRVLYVYGDNSQATIDGNGPGRCGPPEDGEQVCQAHRRAARTP